MLTRQSSCKFLPALLPHSPGQSMVAWGMRLGNNSMLALLLILAVGMQGWRRGLIRMLRVWRGCLAWALALSRLVRPYPRLLAHLYWQACVWTVVPA